MALSKNTLNKIVDVVANDQESIRRINSWLWYLDIADAGIGGPVRNFAMALGYTYTPKKFDFNFDSGDQASMAYRYSCDGIAEASSNAIKANINKIEELANASPQARITGYSHTGTLLEMKDGSKYVLDWWKSLNIKFPFVFKFEDFMYQKSDGVSAQYFTGFF